MYFPFLELQKWRKRSAEIRRRNCAVLPKISEEVKSLAVSSCRFHQSFPFSVSETIIHPADFRCKNVSRPHASDRKIFPAVIGCFYQSGKAVVQMMATIETYAREFQTAMKRIAATQRARSLAKAATYFFGGFALSAASLSQRCQPFAMGFLCALTGWKAAITAMGAGIGYLLLWGAAGYQGIAWVTLALPVALLLGRGQVIHQSVLLMSAISALIVSATGLFFQVLGAEQTPVAVYLVRIVAGAVSARLFYLAYHRRDAAADWLASGIGVLALAQLAPVPGLSLGYVAAGLLAASRSLPAAALAGLALDLSQVSSTPMTGILCLAWLCRLIPYGRKWIPCAAPAAMYLLVRNLGGFSDVLPAVGLAIGGGAAAFLPSQPAVRRGETGAAQVRLEQMAGVLAQTQKLLLQVPELPVDEGAVLGKARSRACGGCPCRKTCPERTAALPERLLYIPLTDTSSLPMACKKPGRLILELRRGQEQLRAMKADRERQGEYRAAVVQQYQFLSLFLQQLSDQLPRRGFDFSRNFTGGASGSRSGSGWKQRCGHGRGKRTTATGASGFPASTAGITFCCATAWARDRGRPSRAAAPHHCCSRCSAPAFRQSTPCAASTACLPCAAGRRP